MRETMDDLIYAQKKRQEEIEEYWRDEARWEAYLEAQRERKEMEGD
jgi:hypothetical protein